MNGLNDIDNKLQKYLDYDTGFFIEAGAYDGFDQSNTYYLEKKRGWSGLLIEPIPENFSKIKNCRSCATYNCALVSNNFVSKKVKVNYAGLMSITDFAMPEKQQNEHIRNGMTCHGLDTSYEVFVQALPLSKVISKFNPSKIDFVSLDVEGYENEVLKGIDFKIHRPEYFLIEERDHEKTSSFLKQHDYKCIDQFSHHDYFYHTKIHN